MTGNLMWLMYLADALSSLKILTMIALTTGCIGSVVFCVVSFANDDKVKFPRWAAWGLLAAAAAATFAPSRQTIYAAAAIYVAGEAAGTEEMQLVRKIITNELREMAEGRKDK